MFDRPPWPGLGANAADQNDLAARLHNAGKLVERGFRIRHRRDHVLRDHGVEGIIGKGQMLGIHHPKPFDVAQSKFGHAILRLAQHLFGYIDAAEPALRE